MNWRFWRRIPPERMGICDMCGTPLGEIDGTAERARCLTCRQTVAAVQEQVRKVPPVLRDVLRPLVEQQAHLVTLMEQGTVTVSARKQCEECHAEYTVALTVPQRMPVRKAEVLRWLRQILPGECPYCPDADAEAEALRRAAFEEVG